jgi:hypothetical protein
VKVRELIARLSNFDPDLMVVQSKDAEAKLLSPSLDVTREYYLPYQPWAGDLAEANEPGAIQVVCIWPNN